jgi:hypothetical protein
LCFFGLLVTYACLQIDSRAWAARDTGDQGGLETRVRTNLMADGFDSVEGQRPVLEKHWSKNGVIKAECSGNLIHQTLNRVSG